MTTMECMLGVTNVALPKMEVKWYVFIASLLRNSPLQMITRGIQVKVPTYENVKQLHRSQEKRVFHKPTIHKTYKAQND